MILSPPDESVPSHEFPFAGKAWDDRKWVLSPQSSHGLLSPGDGSGDTVLVLRASYKSLTLRSLKGISKDREFRGRPYSPYQNWI